ncbi:hypothetical protein WR25_23826 [Diploscapter pachys]|uniref:O-methyltransferase domain-containing protein n=1 Tax=Diploscapter pachys TaxID=2018661 RepID=A0A2A2J8S6_9BILA|nr:hypothetical protein WR25_23826 [Diploscapter pachys]
MASIGKSFESHHDPVINYTTKLSVNLHPLQKELMDKTLAEAEMTMMLGAPEVLTFGQHLIQLTGAKKIIDVGTYTGASALAWAIASKDDAKVYTLDIDHSNYKKFGVPIISKCEKCIKKIEAIEKSAIETLDKFIADGQSGTFDFFFIDADKTNYPNYYHKAVQLLKPGGVVLVDNALWSGRVLDIQENNDPGTVAIDTMNRAISADDKTNSILLNLGDGLHVAFKK